MQGKAVALCMQEFTYQYFGLGVFAPDPAHVVAPYFGFMNIHLMQMLLSSQTGILTSNFDYLLVSLFFALFLLGTGLRHRGCHLLDLRTH